MAQDKTVIHVDLTTDQEARLVKEIEEELSVIRAKRGEIDFDTLVQDRWDMYNGDWIPRWKPWDEAAEYFQFITTEYCDKVTIKALSQTLEANPVLLLAPKHDEVEETDIRDRESRLDFKLRDEDEINLESLLSKGVYREAGVQGTSFVKVPYAFEQEQSTQIEVYQPTEEDYERYKLESIQRLKLSIEEREEGLATLGGYEDGVFVPGEPVEGKVTEKETIKDGPAPYRVPIEKLWVRPDITPLERNRVIAEELDFIWSDIKTRADTKFYKKTAVQKIKDQHPQDYWKRPYTLFECIVYINIKEDDNFQRYIITYEPETHLILRAIHYPYRRIRVNYIPYYVKPRDDSIYGYSLADLLKDTNELVNGLWNGLVDRNALDSNPAKRVSSNRPDLQSIKYGPDAMYQADRDEIEMLELKSRGTNAMIMLQMAERGGEKAVGVSAGQSGQESALDPNAPASKTAMLKQASDEIISFYVIELQKSNAVLGKQVEAIELQFTPDKLSYNAGGKVKEIDAESFAIEMRYYSHGARRAMDKEIELMKIERGAQFLGTVRPDIFQDPEKVNVIATSYLDNLGGTLERQKEKLLAMPEQSGMDIESILAQMENMTPEQQEQMFADMTPEEREAVEGALVEIGGQGGE